MEAVLKRALIPWLVAIAPAALAAAPELYEPILEALVRSGTALEVNTSGLRQSPGETYPPEPVVARYRVLGGNAVTAGSDAHRANDFAFGLVDGYRVVARAGFDQLAFRRGDGQVAVGLPDRIRA